MSIKVDPELARQIKSAAEGELIQAVVSLGSQARARPLSPDEVESVAGQVLQQAQADCGERPSRVKVFRHMESFAVEASPRFLEHLFRHDESLAAAVANQQPAPVVRKSS